MPLEEELREIASAFAAGRDIEIIVTFFGWGGQGVKTLQAVGNEHDISRERVRQIIRKFIKKVQRARPFVPTLTRTIIYISKCVPAVVDDMEAEMHQIGLTRSLFQLDGMISAADVFGVSVPFTIEDYRGIRTVACHEDAGLARSIIRLARRSISHAGLSKVADLCNKIQEEGGPVIGSPIVKRVLQSLTSLRWLDEEFEWFHLDDVRRNHLVTLVTKVLSVAPRIHVSEMHAAIAGDYRGMGFAPPKSVVSEFCCAVCNCSLDGNYLIASRAPSVTEALSKGEQLAYSVLVDDGPLLRRSDFERKCIERGMHLGTFRNYLRSLPILACYGPEVYGLRGVPNVSGDVERSLLFKLAGDGASGQGNLLALLS
jgi:hypothetical protein